MAVKGPFPECVELVLSNLIYIPTAVRLKVE